MSYLNDKLPTWSPDQRAVGDRTYRRVVKGLEKALLASWRACGMTLSAVPRDKLELERSKLQQIVTGDLSDRYFQSVGEVIKSVSASTDVVGWLANGYAPFAAGLVNALLDNSLPFDRRRPEMVESLMRSIFIDAAVVVHHFVQTEQTERTIKSIGDGLAHLAKGDLSHRVTADLTGDFAKLKDDFNTAMNHLQDTIKNVLASTDQISNNAGEVSDAAEDLSRRTEQQAASLEETAAALEEITATVKKTATNAKDARSSVASAKGAAEEGGRVVTTAIQAMDAISQSSKQITDIIGVIDEIAFQTNLLALNAGVEAARAGDAGRGFAVVASEVRALAQRSSEAAKQIKALINASSEQVGSGVKLVGETGAALRQIMEQVQQINLLVSEMAQAAEQQSTGIEEVNSAVAQMDQVTQQNAAMVEQSTAASRNLAGETNTLAELVSFFSVGQTRLAAATRPAASRAASVSKPALRTMASANRTAVAAKAAPVEEPQEDWREF